MNLKADRLTRPAYLDGPTYEGCFEGLTASHEREDGRA